MKISWFNVFNVINECVVVSIQHRQQFLFVIVLNPESETKIMLYPSKFNEIIVLPSLSVNYKNTVEPFLITLPNQNKKKQ